MKNIEPIKINLSLKPFSLSKLNDRFTLCKCYVLALGKNRNMTHISREATDNALWSLPYIPVVAHLMYDEETGVYYVGGHDREVTEDMKLIDMTVPYGVVMDDEFTYEDVVEDSGAVSTYLTCSLILWTGRYCEITEAVYDDEIYFNQSMEIKPLATKKLKTDNRYTDITTFQFDCLTLLGKSDDPNYHTEPCFPSASVIPYAESTDKFSLLFEEMKEELKEVAGISEKVHYEKKKEDNPLDKKMEVLQQYGLTVDDIDFALDDITIEDLSEKLEKEYSTPAESTDPETPADDDIPEGQEVHDEQDDPEGGDEGGEEFALNAIDQIREIDIELSKVTRETDWGFEIPQYYMIEVQGEEIIVEDSSDHYRLYAIPFKMNGDIIEIDYENKVRAKAVYAHYEAPAEPEGGYVFSTAADEISKQFEACVKEAVSKFEKTSASLVEIQEKFEALQTEFEAVSVSYGKLKKDCDDAARADLFSRFDAELTGNEEYEALKAAEDLDVEEAEKTCFALVGKLKFQYTPNKKQPNMTKFGMSGSSKPAQNDPYGGVREKYLNNN